MISRCIGHMSLGVEEVYLDITWGLYSWWLFIHTAQLQSIWQEMSIFWFILIRHEALLIRYCQVSQYIWSKMSIFWSILIRHEAFVIRTCLRAWPTAYPHKPLNVSRWYIPLARHNNYDCQGVIQLICCHGDIVWLLPVKCENKSHICSPHVAMVTCILPQIQADLENVCLTQSFLYSNWYIQYLTLLSLHTMMGATL